MKLPIIKIFTVSISIRVCSAFSNVPSFTTQCSSIPYLSTQLKMAEEIYMVTMDGEEHVAKSIRSLERICPHHHLHPKKNRVLVFRFTRVSIVRIQQEQQGWEVKRFSGHIININLGSWLEFISLVVSCAHKGREWIRLNPDYRPPMQSCCFLHLDMMQESIMSCSSMRQLGSMSLLSFASQLSMVSTFILKHENI